jgi:Tol biopolymer transport system component
LDSRRLELTGKPFVIAERVAVTADGYSAAVSASDTAAIAYRTGSAGGARQFIWFDRSGREINKVGDRGGLTPSMSPDGRLIALSRNENGRNDIWLLETARGVLSRFTSDPSGALVPLWSPDGRSIVFSSIRKGVVDIYQKPVVGAGKEQALLESRDNKVATDWSPDGKFLLYRLNDRKTSFDIWALPVQGDRKPFPVVQTDSGERDGQFSPDGHWIAYESNRSGQSEIYVHPFPGPGREQQISTNGGAQVRWPRNAKELFYVALDGRLMAVPIQITSAIEAGDPVPLFKMRIADVVQSTNTQEYVVSADGQRFLVSTVIEDALSPITLILNWKPESQAGR